MVIVVKEKLSTPVAEMSAELLHSYRRTSEIKVRNRNLLGRKNDFCIVSDMSCTYCRRNLRGSLY